MKIVVAMDAFHGSLAAPDACAAVRRGLLPVLPDADILVRPMADGGPGTAKALLAARGGAWVPVHVRGPLPGTEVEAGLAWLARDRVAFVEAAEACGLALVPADRRDPLRATSAGVGDLLREAVALGALRLLVGAGDSASIDAGTGAAAALGVRFLDALGNEVAPCGANLRSVARYATPNARVLPPITVLAHLDNPLTGEDGAARALGPRKGAAPHDVRLLEEGLAHLERLVERDSGLKLGARRGAGAAGGLAFGAAAFLGAEMVPGAEAVLDAIRLADDFPGADLVITGCGVLDHAAIREKTVGAVSRAARRAGVPVAVLAGRVEPDDAARRAEGLDAVRAIGCEPGEPAGRTAARLETAARMIVASR